MGELSEAGKKAFRDAVDALPNDVDSPVPLCERISQLLDALHALTKRPDLELVDRQIFTQLMHSDRHLLILGDIVMALDLARLARGSGQPAAPVDAAEQFVVDVFKNDYFLFVDDDVERHKTFANSIGRGHRVLWAFTAAEAIDVLTRRDGQIVQAYLDHDLGPDGDGMDVVKHIAMMHSPPPFVAVHSMNYPAAVRMCHALAEIPGVTFLHVPFPTLLEGQ